MQKAILILFVGSTLGALVAGVPERLGWWGPDFTSFVAIAWMAMIAVVIFRAYPEGVFHTRHRTPRKRHS